MRRVFHIEAALKALIASSPFTIYLLIIAIFLPGSNHLLQRSHLSMAKAIASDAMPDKAAAANTMLPARDPQLAVEEEYQAARRQNTIQALNLFIARHPDNPLAAKARADLRSLAR